MGRTRSRSPDPMASPGVRKRGDGGRSALAPAPSRRWGGGEAAPQAAGLPLHRARECSLVKLRRGQQNQFHRATEAHSASIKRVGGCWDFPTSVGAIAHAWSESRLKSSRASAESERPPSWARGTRPDFVRKGTGGDMARDHARRRRATWPTSGEGPLGSVDTYPLPGDSEL